MSTEKKEARFEIRWNAQQKELFERASRLSGFSSLASFITSVVQKRAEELVEEHERILASERDKERFFDALMSESAPNDALKRAAKSYKRALER